MSTSTLVVLLLVIGLPLAMMFMHRGGHAHGGAGGGGCGGGHGGHDSERSPDERGELEKRSPVAPAAGSGDAGHNHGTDDATS